MASPLHSHKDLEMYCMGKTQGVQMMCAFFGWEVIYSEPEWHFWEIRNSVNGDIKMITTDPTHLDPGEVIKVVTPDRP